MSGVVSVFFCRGSTNIRESAAEKTVDKEVEDVEYEEE